MTNRARAKGRVFFTAGKELDRFVVWDYVSRRRSIIGSHAIRDGA